MITIILELQCTTNTINIMPSSNIDTLSTSNENHGQPSGLFSNSGIEMIHIGKDMQHVAISKMVSINIYSWMTSPSFETLTNISYLLVEVYSVGDVISLVAN